MLVACAAGETPEQQLRAWVAQGEAAVESRSVSGFAAQVSARYRDRQGRNRRQLLALAARYFLGHRDIHLLTRIRRIELIDRQRARLTLLVAMAGRPFPDPQRLPGFRADLYRFQLALAREQGEWRLTGAEWRRSSWPAFLE
ncbi:MAG TPA: hypothetical protein ENK50_06185 [Sedimenticola sp.]|nr:hypothetical protein [Sedimenticola sp.]